jgi:hypothetical protein
LSALIFKLANDPYVGNSICPVIPHEQEGAELFNPRSPQRERLGRLLNCTPTIARDRHPVRRRIGGSAVEATVHGDTRAPRTIVVLERIHFPSRWCHGHRAPDAGGPEKLAIADRPDDEDPTFRVATN